MELISKNNTEQQQTAGNNSNQIIISGNLNVGITESQARDICKAECAIALQNWSFQAGVLAEKRIQKLEDKMLPKILSYDEKLSIFGEPGFQILIRKAQIAAASSERESDYEMLADLLLHRAEQQENRERRLGISKAIEIVDQIDDLALIALSIVYAVSKYTPVSSNIHEGLGALNKLYGKILNKCKLPTDYAWMEHLDLLAAIRLSPSGIHSFKKLEEYIPERLNYYFEEGLQVDSDDYNHVLEKFESLNIPLSCLERHPLRDGYVRLNVPKDIDNIVFIMKTQQGEIKIPLSEKQKDAFRLANKIAFKTDSNNSEMKKAFWNIWDKYQNLKDIRLWWDKLEKHFSITPVGVALANAYIRGKEPSIPCIY